MSDSSTTDSPATTSPVCGFTSIPEVFASFGIDVVAGPDGSLEASGVAAQRLAERLAVARRAHEVVANASSAELPALADVAAGIDAASVAQCPERHCVVARDAVLATLVSVDLAVRLESLLDAGDPFEELLFLVNAAESGDIGSLGERLIAAEALLCAPRS